MRKYCKTNHCCSVYPINIIFSLHAQRKQKVIQLPKYLAIWFSIEGRKTTNQESLTLIYNEMFEKINLLHVIISDKIYQFPTTAKRRVH